MDQHQQQSQCSVENVTFRPFEALLGNHASVITPIHEEVETSGPEKEEMSPALKLLQVVGDALSSMIIFTCVAAETRWRRDHRKLSVCYFATVFCIRLLLRSPIACELPEILVACLEDSMSLLSFALGLLYLHGGADGIGAFAKRVLNSPEVSETSPRQEETRFSAPSLLPPRHRAALWLLMP